MITNAAKEAIGNEGEADSVAVRAGCVVTSVGEGTTTDKPWGIQAMERTRTERKYVIYYLNSNDWNMFLENNGM